MAALTAASKANGTLLLPAMRVAAHVTQSNPHDGIVIEYKDVLSLGKMLLSQEDTTSFKLDEKITLMNWGDAIITNILADQSGATPSP